MQSAKANGLSLIAWQTYVLEELLRCTNNVLQKSLNNYDRKDGSSEAELNLLTAIGQISITEWGPEMSSY